MSITPLFCNVDDFCKEYVPELNQLMIGNGKKTRNRKATLSLSEMMTIIILFHRSNYRTFKHFYIKYVMIFLRKEFPYLVSYNRFVELMPRTLIPLCAYLQTRKGRITGISFIDSTPITVCHNRRIKSHKVFKGFAKRGKNSIGWFFGFKLHLIINEHGELLAFKVTTANIDDRKPVKGMTGKLFGKLFGDKGYISKKLFDQLLKNGVQLITKLKSGMKGHIMPFMDKILLRKRSLIETVNDQLKNISQIEHHRHRSISNFMVNLVAGLVAYTWQPKKPSLNINMPEMNRMPVAV
jgi:hypothetical protein